MTIVDLRDRLTAIIEDNDVRHPERNGHQVYFEMSRRGRSRSWFVPVQYASASSISIRHDDWVRPMICLVGTESSAIKPTGDGGWTDGLPRY